MLVGWGKPWEESVGVILALLSRGVAPKVVKLYSKSSAAVSGHPAVIVSALGLKAATLLWECRDLAAAFHAFTTPD